MSDEQQFQSADKECFLEIVNSNHLSYNVQMTPQKHKSQSQYASTYDPENNLTWKFQKIKKALPSSILPSPRKMEAKNISFQTDDFQDGSDDNKSDISQKNVSISAFNQKYEKAELIYKAPKKIGTNWLNKKQYYASVFIDPQILAKNSISMFNRKSMQQHNIDSQSNTKLFTFSSQFESANLHTVYRINNNEYDLLLQNDINSKGNTQWFYFQIANIPAKTKIKFNIVNMMKNDSLFNYGMQPCVFSKQAHAHLGQGWTRSGTAIRYFKNQTKVDGSNRFYYTLTFTITTQYQNDSIKVAQSYPYSVEDLNNFLDQLEKKSSKKGFLKRQSAGLTIGKKNIEIVKIMQQNPRKKQKRPLIIVSARQHPGETPGSFVCEGFLQYITSEDKQASFLRKNYEICVLPMINPDGVTVGNYRTNLCGVDLNRRWDGSKSKLALETVLVKKYLLDLTKGRDVAFMIDLHGHSRKLFSFFYGNSNEQNPIQVRIFPYICSKISEQAIRFEDSTFVCEEAKKKTARVQLASKFKSSNVFTFETSFYGYINSKRERVHYTEQKLKNLGAIIGKSMFIHERSKTSNDSLQAMLIKKYLGELSSKPQLIKCGDKEGSGSETEPEKAQADEEDLSLLNQKIEIDDPKQLLKNQKSGNKGSKKQIIFKEISKQSRQLHVMDIARVNPIFPNDVFALMPASAIKKAKQKQKNIERQKSKKDKKKDCVHQSVQTDDVPIIKIYDTCKAQQNKHQSDFSRKKKAKNQNQVFSASSRSNLFRTIVRPKSSSNSYLEPNSPNPVYKIQLKRKYESGTQLIQKKNKARFIPNGVQTTISFPPDADFIAKTLDSLLISSPAKGLQTLQRKTKTNFSTISPQADLFANKNATHSFKIGLRALNVQTWRIKKKNMH